MDNSSSEKNVTYLFQSVPTTLSIILKISEFQFVVSGVLLTAVSAVGIVANIVSLIVLSQPQMRLSVNCLLQGLAVFDTALLVMVVLLLGLNNILNTDTSLSYYSLYIYPVLFPAIYPMVMIAQAGSIWTTVAVTVERYVAVCHPLQVQYFCTYNRARLCNIFVFLFAVVYNVPRVFEVDQQTIWDSSCNCSLLVVKPSELRQNIVYVQLYYTWMYLIVINFVPFTTLAILNVRIWKSVRLANANRQNLTQSQEKEVNLAVMLLCVVAVFFVCNVLGPVQKFLDYCDIFIPHLMYVLDLLVTVNSSANFFIYCIYGRKFRRVFLETFCCRDSRRPDITATTRI